MSANTWIAFGDLHDDLSPLRGSSRLREAIRSAQGVIISGDMTFRGGIAQAAEVVDALAELNPRVLAQIGNMDMSEITGWLVTERRNIHKNALSIAPGVVLMGLGCSNPTPFGTPSEASENELASWLRETLETAPAHDHLILISHTPPLHTACDQLAGGGHAGSLAVREFIEEYQPAVCICGHIHESRAGDRLGKTQIVNPGNLAAGGYAALILDNDGPRAELRAF